MSPITHTPRVRPRRILALLLIALTAGGLGVVSLTSGSERVSVPPGARAGQLTLEPCTYEAEHADLPADCGTLVVPENRRNPDSRLIALPVTRVHARNPDGREPIFRLEGGPGLSNMKFPFADRFVAERDVVLVGYRGVDGSSRLDCPEVSSALERPRDLLGAAARRDMVSGFRSCSERLQAGGTDLAGYTLPQRVEDLEDARKAMGYDRIDLVSESMGTRIALIYSQRHPDRIHRSVMVAVNPPGGFLWDGAVTDGQIRRYAAMCAHAPACRSRTGDLAATMRRVARDMPDRWLGMPVHRGNARIGSFFGLMEATDVTAPLSAPMTMSSWIEASRGDASGLWLMSFMANLVFPEGQVWGDLAAIARSDARAAQRHFAQAHAKSTLGDAASRFLFAGGDILDAWPGNADDDAYDSIGPTDTETLLVSGEMDFATPPRNSRELLPALRNGRRVVIDGIGHTNDFWSHSPPASTRLITRYLDSGRVDTSLYRPRTIDLDSWNFQTTGAKGFAGAMIGLPLLSALVLAGIARRVRRRGRLGSGSSAVVRSLLAAVVGVAGWLLAVYAVLSSGAGVPVDDPSLVMVAVALPVAAATHLGWTDRRRPRGTRLTGLAAAVAGAVLGARLGFGATEQLLAPLTAVAGAVAGANLAVIARDVSAGDDAVRPATRPLHEALVAEPRVPA